MTLLGKVRVNWWLARACRDWPTVLAMKRRAPSTNANLRALHFRALEKPVLYRPGTTDIDVAWEIFQGEEYACTRPFDFATIVDCGANVGMFLAFAVMKMGQGLKRYVGVEADRAAFATLESQTIALDVAPKSCLLHAAAWDRDGEVCFDDQGPSWGRHVSPDGGVRVRAFSIESILDAAGLDECDLLKLDIEGGERTVLPQMKSWRPRVRTIVAELHDGLDYAWFAGIAEKAGYEPFPPGRLFHSHPGAIRR